MDFVKFFMRFMQKTKRELFFDSPPKYVLLYYSETDYFFAYLGILFKKVDCVNYWSNETFCIVLRNSLSHFINANKKYFVIICCNIL